ncbi:hypothetical protein MtrunA17_Chr4g0027541 [Medicago truncatula]|nr:hypothetical protein MtrunA17_Chr4g0027541 [Medicago truncatula]
MELYKENATSIISNAAYLLVAGSGNFAQNYFINPILQKLYTPYQFSDVLMQEYYNFIQARPSQPCIFS